MTVNGSVTRHQHECVRYHIRVDSVTSESVRFLSECVRYSIRVGLSTGAFGIDVRSVPRTYSRCVRVRGWSVSRVTSAFGLWARALDRGRSAECCPTDGYTVFASLARRAQLDVGTENARWEARTLALEVVTENARRGRRNRERSMGNENTRS